MNLGPRTIRRGFPTALTFIVALSGCTGEAEEPGGGPSTLGGIPTSSGTDPLSPNSEPTAPGGMETGITLLNGLTSLDALESVSGLSIANGLSTSSGLSSTTGLMTSFNGRITVSYLVRCALPAGRKLVKKDQNDASYTYLGVMGMGAGWENGACDARCQEGVSACLLALVNTSGVHIPLWLASPAATVGWGHGADFPNQEGTYFGNIFKKNPTTNTIDAFYCNGPDFAESTVPGRLGAYQPNAPYSNPFGKDAVCASHCDVPAVPHQRDGFRSCKGYNIPVTVWRKPHDTFDPNQDYKICSKLSGKCLDGEITQTGDHARLQQWSYGGADNQRWRITALGDNYFKICAKYNGNCLDVQDGSQASGATVQLWSFGGSAWQRWAITSVGTDDKGTRIFSVVAKSGAKSIDVKDKGLGNGVPIQQWTYYGSPQQSWTITPVN